MVRMFGVLFSVLALVFSGCGQFKTSDERIALVETEGGHSEDSDPFPIKPIPAAEETQGCESELDNFSKFVCYISYAYEFYSREGGFTVTEVNNIFNKLGWDVPAEDVQIYHGLLDGNTDGRVDFLEVQNSLDRLIPAMSFIEKGRSFTVEKFKQKINQIYKGSSVTARSGLMQILEKYDQEWAGGNGNGILESRELSIPGVIISVSSNVEFEDGLPEPYRYEEYLQGDKKDLIIHQIRNKVDMYLFGRYPDANHRTLPEQDVRVEWTRIVLEGILVERLLRNYDDFLSDANVVEALGTFGFKVTDQSDLWVKIRKHYDSPFNLGNGDGILSFLEVFNLITDYSHSQVVLEKLKSDQDALQKHLKRIYPKVADNLFFGEDGKQFRKEFWTFQSPAEVLHSLGNARLLDIMFFFFDLDEDGKMQKKETAKLMRLFDFDDPRAVDVLHSDAVTADQDIMMKVLGVYVKLYSGGKTQSELNPFEVFQRLDRLVEVMN